MDRRFATITLAIVLLLVAGYLTLDAVHLEIHFLLGRLNHGVSSGKILFLLGFVAAAMLRLVFCRSHRGRPKWSYAILVSAIAIGLSGSMAAHLHYVSTYDLPLGTPTFHGQGGHLSVNSTTHIHVSKAAIAHTVNAAGLTSLHTRFDTGHVYLSAPPAWLAITIGLAWLVATAMAVWLTPCAVHRLPNLQRQACVLLWALAGCAVSKCILDGGPLAYDAVVGTLCLWFVAGGMTKKRIVIGTGVVIAWLAVVLGIDPAHALTQAVRAIERGAIYGLIGVCGYWLAHAHRPTLALRLGTGVLTAVAVGMTSFAWTRHITPLRQPYDHYAIHYHIDKHHHVDARPIGQSTIHNATSLYELAGENPLRPRRTSAAPRIAGVDYQLLGEVGFIKTQGDQLSLPATDIARFTRTQADETYQGPGERMRFIWKIDGQLGPVMAGPPNQLTQNERFVGYYLLDQALRDAGVEEYILTPYLVVPIQRGKKTTAWR